MASNVNEIVVKFAFLTMNNNDYENSVKCIHTHTNLLAVWWFLSEYVNEIRYVIRYVTVVAITSIIMRANNTPHDIYSHLKFTGTWL